MKKHNMMKTSMLKIFIVSHNEFIPNQRNKETSVYEHDATHSCSDEDQRELMNS